MKKEVFVEVKLTAQDIFKFLMYHSFSTWQGKITWILGFIALAMAPIMMFVAKDNFSALVFLVVAIMYLIITPLSFYNNAKRQMLTNSVFKNKIAFTFAEEVFQVKQYTGQVSFFWHQLSRISIAKEFYLLYINSKQAFIVPKRFVEASEVAVLDQLLESKKGLANHEDEAENKSDQKLEKTKNLLKEENGENEKAVDLSTKLKDVIRKNNMDATAEPKEKTKSKKKNKK